MESLGEFRIDGPEWASGCEACRFGLAVAPIPVGILLLHEQRAVEAADGDLVFCDCRAGFMYRQYLRKAYAKIEERTRENIRRHLQVARTPTVHGA